MDNYDKLQFMMYERLLFEVKILRNSLQSIIINEIEKNREMNEKLYRLQKTFYIISNNLYPS